MISYKNQMKFAEIKKFLLKKGFRILKPLNDINIISKIMN